MTPKKITVHSETVYFASMFLLALAVAISAAADLGLSMIVSPAFIFSQKFPIFTFGQSEYIVQGILFLILCIAMRRVKLIYFSSFVSCLIYGAMLDLIRLIPLFDPAVTPPASLPMAVRILFFAIGMLLCAFSVSLSFHTYFLPVVYDFFVKGISLRYGIPLSKFKYFFDASCLAASLIMTFAFFGRLVGIGVGTIVTTLLNGFFIGAFDKLFTRRLNVVPLFPKLEMKFEI